MNFNYLLSARQTRKKCNDTLSDCYFIPAGNIRSTQGDNIHLTMLCRKCGQREEIFLSRQEYFKQQKLIEKEIKNV
jgi:transcription initiation factor IIE alpha subunit